MYGTDADGREIGFFFIQIPALLGDAHRRDADATNMARAAWVGHLLEEAGWVPQAPVERCALLCSVLTRRMAYAPIRI